MVFFYVEENILILFFEFADPDEECDTGFNRGFGEPGFVVKFIDKLFF